VTVAVAVVVTVGLVLLMFVLPVPYVIEQPGPVLDTLGAVPGNGPQVVQISNAKTYPSSGHIYLTTVNEVPGNCDQHPSLSSTLSAWFNGDDAVIPAQAVCPPNQPAGTVVDTDQTAMTRSQSNAEIAALKFLGYRVTGNEILIGGVVPKSPASQYLKPRDILVSIDGARVHSAEQVVQLVRRHPPGYRLPVVFRRDGQQHQVTITTARAPTSAGTTDPHTAFLGITPASLPQFNGINVNIGIDPDYVGGPSAGTALALGIVDKLTPGGITGGRTIAGTGAITASGKIQQIGGIQQKVAAAVAKHATVFFAPAANCADAKAQAPASLTLIKALTLREVVAALKDISAGRSDFPHC
jgi:PDZ domain-containing protein